MTTEVSAKVPRWAFWVVGVLVGLLKVGLIAWLSVIFSLTSGNRERVVALETETRMIQQSIEKNQQLVIHRLDRLESRQQERFQEILRRLERAEENQP